MPALRFGILLPAGRRPSAWQHTILDELTQPGLAELAVCVPVPAPVDPGPRPSPLWRLYRRLTRALRALDQPPAAVALAPADAEYLRTLRLDFLMNFTGALTAPAWAGLARHGVWTYQLGRWHPRFPEAPCFGEILHGERVVAVTLRAEGTPAGPPVILHAGKIGVQWRYSRTLDAVLAASAGWAGRAARELTLNGACAAAPAAADPAPPAPLSTRQWLSFLKQQARAGRRALMEELFFYDIWNVGVGPRPAAEALPELGAITWLPAQPPRQYLADPFLITDRGRRALLAEEYRYARPARGRIVQVMVDTERLTLEPQLSAPGHLSYPCVVTADGETYCIPESHRLKQCRLYRRLADGAWRLERVLLENCAAVDPTVFWHAGWWWLFCTDQRAGHNLKLFAYYAAALEGEWRPHALNPLKCDVTSARPAGPPFTLHGRLYRPAQDCSQTYGGAVTLNEVLALSPTAFAERPVRHYQPDPAGPYPAGLHHLTVAEDLIVIDGKRRVCDPFFKIRAWLS